MLSRPAVCRERYFQKPSMDTVNILIIDDDKASQSALQQVLDSEGWRVRIASNETQALQDLAAGRWTLVIASAGMTGLAGPLYTMLAELASAPLLESGKARLRVLFMVPELSNTEARRALEHQRLPYVLKPYHFHDFLEKVSDLLMETEAITAPIRRVRLESQGRGRRAERGAAREMGSSHASAPSGPGAARNTGMFANREYSAMTEEEIADYERQEAEETQRKKKKKLEPSGA
jgi:DNA-binding NtrC family response regulator